MRTFNYTKTEELSLDMKAVNLLISIHEQRERNTAFILARPESLQRLVESAKIESVTFSNAIEGIKTTSARLSKLVRGQTSPRTRSEEEIAGYRDVLNLIHESYEYIPLNTNHILQLHGMLFKYVKGCNYGGKLKSVQNYIQGSDEFGNVYTLFTPLAPFETREALDSLCNEYNKAIQKGEVDPLILIPIFIHDFLCIHPFNDGNGRMSRLLTVLLLYRSGYSIVKYMSLEARIDKIKDLYYDSLGESQIGWHEGKDNPLPFVRYILSIVSMCYLDLNERIDLVKQKKPIPKIVEEAIDKRLGKIKKAELFDYCPGVSYSAIEKAIAEMVRDLKLEKHGEGKSTFYIKK